MKKYNLQIDNWQFSSIIDLSTYFLMIDFNRLADIIQKNINPFLDNLHFLIHRF